jgi:hypothetical protein
VIREHHVVHLRRRIEVFARRDVDYGVHSGLTFRLFCLRARFDTVFAALANTGPIGSPRGRIAATLAWIRRL